MIKNRWMIPALFGAICAVLAVCSFALSSEGVVHSGAEGLKIGQAKTWAGLELEPNRRYVLKLQPSSGVQLNNEVIVSATLSRDDATLFTIEDAYWHERGHWSEGGESGSWEEQNSSSEFSFVVPEAGKYDLELALESATSIAGDRIEMLLVWKEPWPLTAWPLIIGAFALFALAGWSHSTRRAAMGRFIEELGEGTRLRIAEMEYSVIGRMEHWEPPERVGVEFRLRGTDGSERWLAVERYWREHPYIEDGEQTLVQTLLDVPLSPVQSEKLAEHDAGVRNVRFGADLYDRDKENCGFGTLVTIRDGAAYQTRYSVDVYRLDRFPSAPGDLWIECMKWIDSGEIEWAVMRIADTDEIDVLEPKIAVQMSRAEIFDDGPAKADPFGVAQLRGPRADVNRTSSAATKDEKQRQPHDMNS